MGELSREERISDHHKKKKKKKKKKIEDSCSFSRTRLELARQVNALLQNIPACRASVTCVGPWLLSEQLLVSIGLCLLSEWLLVVVTACLISERLLVVVGPCLLSDKLLLPIDPCSHGILQQRQQARARKR